MAGLAPPRPTAHRTRRRPTLSALAVLATLAPTDTRGGFPKPGSEDFFFDPVTVFGRTLAWKPGGLDLSINRVVLLEFLTAGLLCLLFAAAFRRPRVVPSGAQNVLEALIGFLKHELVDDVVGERGRKFTAYFLALFFFIWFGNMLEIVPGIEFPINSRTGLPLALALITLGLYLYQGMKVQGAGRYWKDALFPPGIPKFTYLLITPIEFVTLVITRPFTLFIRLSANMIAGHLLLGIMYVATDYLLFGFHYGKSFTAIFAAGSFLGAIVFTGFELFVATLQAYIFTLLTGVYLAGALEPQH